LRRLLRRLRERTHQRRPRQHDEGTYRRLEIELAIDFVVMYLVMCTMIATLDDFYPNLNNAYMTLMMAMPNLISSACMKRRADPCRPPSTSLVCQRRLKTTLASGRKLVRQRRRSARSPITVLEPITVALEGLGVVDEAVDHRRGDGGIAEHLAPAAERLPAQAR
jgi:hypothetical protein